MTQMQLYYDSYSSIAWWMMVHIFKFIRYNLLRGVSLKSVVLVHYVCTKITRESKIITKCNKSSIYSSRFVIFNYLGNTWSIFVVLKVTGTNISLIIVIASYSKQVLTIDICKSIINNNHLCILLLYLFCVNCEISI